METRAMIGRGLRAGILLLALLTAGVSAAGAQEPPEITATSYLSDDGEPRRYAADRAFDGDPRTAWVEGVAGPGIDESIRIGFAADVTIREIRVMPGYFDRRWWAANNRVKEAVLRFDGGERQLVFADVMEAQGTRFDPPITAREFTLVIRSVYPGSRWDDTCIAEIELLDHAGPTPEQIYERAFESGDTASLIERLRTDPGFPVPGGEMLIRGAWRLLLPEAARTGSTALVTALLHRGLDVDQSGVEGTTALKVAAGRGDLAMVRHLLAAGANVSFSYQGTALWYAAGNGHLEVVRELAKAGSDVNYRDIQGLSGLSVVEVAFENGHDDVAALLILTYGAEDTVGVENLR